MERAILFGMIDSSATEQVIVYDWTEFVELVRTAGAIEVGRIVQNKNSPDPAFFIGSGKAQLLAEEAKEKAADLIISIQELSPVQVRNLEDLCGVRVIDRTDLILDIFAGRAHSKEGKLQVELAQLNYMLPRLKVNTVPAYSRLGGGIGTRGPGESKLEVDKRQVRQRIKDLSRQLVEVENHRDIQRHLREKNEIATVSLVGYTNSGKSTLFNRLTNESVSAENRLFDTLDPISRKIKLPSNKEAILLDTVGFVRNLPHQLVAAFKATLEETIRANLLLLVLDAGSQDLGQHFKAVQDLLEELKISDKDILVVLNKVDLLDSDFSAQRLAHEWSALPISAKTGAGIDDLLLQIERKIAPSGVYRVLLPFNEGGLLDLLHQKSKVLEEVYEEDGVHLLIESEKIIAEKIQKYIITQDFPC